MKMTATLTLEKGGIEILLTYLIAFAALREQEGYPRFKDETGPEGLHIYTVIGDPVVIANAVNRAGLDGTMLTIHSFKPIEVKS